MYKRDSIVFIEVLKSTGSMFIHLCVCLMGQINVTCNDIKLLHDEPTFIP